MLEENTQAYFKHFGESLNVKIGDDITEVVGIFNAATTSKDSIRAEANTTLPHAVFTASSVSGIDIGDTITRDAITYYVIDYVADYNMITVYLSEDAP